MPMVAAVGKWWWLRRLWWVTFVAAEGAVVIAVAVAVAFGGCGLFMLPPAAALSCASFGGPSVAQQVASLLPQSMVGLMTLLTAYPVSCPGGYQNDRL